MGPAEIGGWIAGGACALFALRAVAAHRRDRVPGSHYLALAFLALGVAVSLGGVGEVRSTGAPLTGAPPAGIVIDRLVLSAGAAYAASLVWFVHSLATVRRTVRVLVGVGTVGAVGSAALAVGDVITVGLLAVVWVVAHGVTLRSLWLTGGELVPSRLRLRIRVVAVGLLVVGCVSPLMLDGSPGLLIAVELAVVLSVTALWLGLLPPVGMRSLRTPTAAVRDFESAVVRSTDPRSVMRRLSDLAGRVTGASEVWLLRDGEVEAAYGLDVLAAVALSADLPAPGGGPDRVRLDERSWLLSVPFGTGRMVLRTGVCTPLIDSRTTDAIQRMADLAALSVDRAEARLAERQMRERIDGLADAKDEFLSNVSHELRTPLTVIQGVAELLQRDLEQVRRLQTDLLARLGDNVQALIGILGSFERLASVRRDQRLQVLNRFPLPSAVAAALRLIEDDHPGQRFEVDATDMPMSQDQTAVVRAVVELLTNAAEHSASADPIEVTASAAGDDAVVEITDRGRGMTPEELASASEPFYRTDGASTRGAGIGLTVVEELADQLGGTFELRSEVGQGTTATLRIPQTHPRSLELGLSPAVPLDLRR